MRNGVLLSRDLMSALFTTNVNKISEDKDVDLLLEQYPKLWQYELGYLTSLMSQ